MPASRRAGLSIAAGLDDWVLWCSNGSTVLHTATCIHITNVEKNERRQMQVTRAVEGTAAPGSDGPGGTQAAPGGVSRSGQGGLPVQGTLSIRRSSTLLICSY